MLKIQLCITEIHFTLQYIHIENSYFKQKILHIFCSCKCSLGDPQYQPIIKRSTRVFVKYTWCVYGHTVQLCCIASRSLVRAELCVESAAKLNVLLTEGRTEWLSCRCPHWDWVLLCFIHVHCVWLLLMLNNLCGIFLDIQQEIMQGWAWALDRIVKKGIL